MKDSKRYDSFENGSSDEVKQLKLQLVHGERIKETKQHSNKERNIKLAKKKERDQNVKASDQVSTILQPSLNASLRARKTKEIIPSKLIQPIFLYDFCFVEFIYDAAAITKHT